MKLKFTKRALLAVEPPEAGKRLTVYDIEIPKLAMRVTSSGSRTFYVVKRAGASMSWVKLGGFPEMTVEQARSEAQKVLGKFASGADPAAARRAIRQEPTFNAMLSEMLEKKRKRNGAHITERTKKDYLDTARLHMGSIANAKLSQVTRSAVTSIHRQVSKNSPRQADKAVAIISSVFNFAADHEHFSGINPAGRIQKNEIVERDRFAQASELPYLFGALNKSAQGHFFLLALLTGARRSNVQAMTWHDIDFESRVWRVDMTKNGTPQNVTLSNEAIEILKLRKRSAKGSPFVFPGTGKTGHLVELKKAWAAVLRHASLLRLLDTLERLGKLDAEGRQQAEEQVATAPITAERRLLKLAKALQVDPALYDMTDLRIHDLRRTLASWQAKTGATLPIIGKSLNQKSLKATLIYARLDLDPVRQSVETATQAMLQIANGGKKSYAPEEESVAE